MAGAAYAAADLNEAACRKLLSTVEVGRLGFTVGALPRILPVPFTVRGEEVITGSLRGSAAVSPRPGDVVVFEAESYDPTIREGWCAGVVGPCRVLTDPDEIATIHVMAIAPWIPAQAGDYFAITMGLFYGRTLTRRCQSDDDISNVTAWQRTSGLDYTGLHGRLAHAEHRADKLQQAVHSNRRIGMALGIIMGRRGLTEAQAFRTLREQSNERNVKIRDLAEQIIYTGRL